MANKGGKKGNRGGGVNKLPTALHILNGNPSKLDLKERLEKEPLPDLIDPFNHPPAPEWLDPVAAKEWDRAVPMLAKIKLLTEADLKAIEAYCKTYSRWREAEEFMDAAHSTVMKTGKGQFRALPQVKIALGYLVQCREFMREFGMTPQARSRLTLPNDEVNDQDEMEKLLSGMK